MKANRVLLFLICTGLLIGITWFFYPKEGIQISSVNLRFPSYAADTERENNKNELDVDSVLNRIEQSFIMNYSESIQDSLHYFRKFLRENNSRIHFPNNDYTYFDPFYRMLEQNSGNDLVYRIMHYGDSQIEMDRITSVIREYFQKNFGGRGVGMIPVIQRIPTTTLSQKASGALQRYIIFGDSTTRRAPHRRYGVMAQFSQLSGEASLWFNSGGNKNTQTPARKFSRVSILMGNGSPDFSAQLRCDTFHLDTKRFPEGEKVALLRWDLPNPVEKGTLNFKGSGELYAVLLDGDGGVAVDNDALRGCSGTIFTRIDKEVLQNSFSLLNTRMIILQFGGNRMPSIKSSTNISRYMNEIEKQLQLFKRVAPKATILFIGPADMGKRVEGVMGTWPKLPELNDSLCAVALRNDIAYWDLFNVMGGENSMAKWVKHRPPLAGSDYIHFTPRGAQEVGNILSQSFDTYYNFFRLRKELPTDSVYNFINEDYHMNDDPVNDSLKNSTRETVNQSIELQ